jgi:hypothetical protein
LGSGVYVDSTGTYLYSDQFGDGKEPASQFTVINVAGDTIYAGANINSVSGWSVSQGIIIESGASYTFGEPGTDIIRNVWACTAHLTGTASDSLVGGYATLQDNWI